MLVLGLFAAAVVVGFLAALVRWTWQGWRRSEAQACVTEEEARKNALPLTTAILPGSPDGERESSLPRNDKPSEAS